MCRFRSSYSVSKRILLNNWNSLDQVVGNAARQLWLRGSFGEVIGFVKRFLYYNPTAPSESEATSSTSDSANQLSQLIKDYRIEFSSRAQIGLLL